MNLFEEFPGKIQTIRAEESYLSAYLQDGWVNADTGTHQVVGSSVEEIIAKLESKVRKCNCPMCEDW